MNDDRIEKLLRQVREGDCGVDDALREIKRMNPDPLGFACLDHHRNLRTGIPEVVFAENKSAEQICSIFASMLERPGVVMATRVTKEKGESICHKFPEAMYHEEARMIVARQLGGEISKNKPLVGILSAGTSDVQVAEEARVTAVNLGCRVEAAYDVGVAGIHRLYSRHELLSEAAVLVVVAGMEGALPSVVAGLVEAPVIAVPTSVGYGTGFGGIAALLGMLNSCAPGMAVVNIDNGFGAGCMASQIVRVAERQG
ncbi:MAG: nickel pincer cofactor biosynthesis protein LarB [Desulfobulbaceae bacterium]|nr:nickel pincer cofactor biosynthesis protein LarB [Desulfobulbaceae bacterium]